jgi:hypothetical protein
MAYTTENLEALEAALASGALTVQQGGQSITYRSVEQLKAAIAYVRDGIAGDAAAAAGTTASPRIIRTFTRKGF